MPDRQQGFTLIEMLVVIAILGIVIGVVVSHGPQRSAGLDARAAAGALVQTFRSAHATSMAKSTQISIAIDPVRREFGPDGGPARRLASSVSVEVLPPVVKGPGDVRYIRFMPDGSATGGGVVLGVGQRHLRVEVQWLTGQVKVSDAK